MLTKVTKSDKAFAKRMTAKPKAESYTLVYQAGDSQTIIDGLDRVDYKLCKWKKNQIRHYMQYRTGNLNIIPNYGKDN